MKVSIQLTPDDCVAARWVAVRPRRTLRVVGYLLIVLVVLVLGLQLTDFVRGTPLPTEFWWVSGAMVYFAVLFFVLIPWQIRRVFRQQKTLHSPCEVEFSDTGFAGTSAHGSLSIAWSDFHKWKVGKKCILLYQSEAIMHVIPSRAFTSDDQRAAVVQLLEAKMGKQRA